MRLDKFLSQQLGISRASVMRELRAKKIRLDGEIVKNGAVKINIEQQVEYEGQVLLQIEGYRYFMLHKPEGFVCSTSDPEHPTILYFIDEPAAEKLHAAGRLDKDATGLVLLTDDGQWSHKITSPRHNGEKTYRVTLAEPLADNVAERFAAGVMLNGEKQPTKPARLEKIDDFCVYLTISEGRYHQVKRMFAAVNNKVLTLHRERIGNLFLDPALAPGEYRALTEDEIAEILSPSVSVTPPSL